MSATVLRLSKSRLALIEEATQIETASAREAGAIAYMARLLVQVTMPPLKAWNRSLRTIQRRFHRPDARRRRGTRSPIRLDAATRPRLADNLHDVGIIPAGQHVSGGKRGARTYAQRQTMALFNAIVSWYYADRSYRGSNIPIASEFSLAWDRSRTAFLTLTVFRSAAPKRR